MPPSHPQPSTFARRLSQWICGLHGHDMQLRIGIDHLALRCRYCSLDSPGWGLGRGARPEVETRSEPASSASASPPVSAPAQ